MGGQVYVILWNVSKTNCSCVAFEETLDFLKKKRELKLERGEEGKVLCLKTNK